MKTIINKRYELSISTIKDLGSDWYIHIVSLTDIKSEQEVTLKVRDKKKYFQPYSLYEDTMHYLVTPYIKSEQWETAIKELDKQYKKLRYKK